MKYTSHVLLFFYIMYVEKRVPSAVVSFNYFVKTAYYHYTFLHKSHPSKKKLHFFHARFPWKCFKTMTDHYHRKYISTIFKTSPIYHCTLDIFRHYFIFFSVNTKYFLPLWYYFLCFLEKCNHVWWTWISIPYFSVGVNFLLIWTKMYILTPAEHFKNSPQQ